MRVDRSRSAFTVPLLLGLVAGCNSPPASTSPPPASGDFVNWESPHVSPLALTPSGKLLLAVNTADNRLEVFDATAPLPMPVRSIAVGLDPVTVRARNDHEAWV